MFAEIRSALSSARQLVNEIELVRSAGRADIYNWLVDLADVHGYRIGLAITSPWSQYRLGTLLLTIGQDTLIEHVFYDDLDAAAARLIKRTGLARC